jgi:NAD+ kinase
MSAATANSALLFYNHKKPKALRWAGRVRTHLRRKGFRVVNEKNASTARFAIAIGGDGTMLRAARAVAPFGIPVAGINAGGLGFLSSTEREEAERDLDRIIDGRFPIQERWMLSAEAFRGTRRVFGPSLALNDCVVKPAAPARAFFLETSLGAEFLTNFFGDGLIVSTPTGSTAYALSAGGPVVEPELDVLVVAPICPHDLTQRPLVLPFDRPLTVKIRASGTLKDVPALVSMDGQVNRLLQPGDTIVVQRYSKPFRLMVNPRRHYFHVLREKLLWGAERRTPRR